MPRPIAAAAALSFTAALIHASVAPAHFAEYWAFGAFFVVVAVLQLAWAEMARRGAGRGVLLIGAVANLAVASIWLASRTVGMPIGPDAGQAEGVGLQDALATLDEVGIAVLVLLTLLPRARTPLPTAVVTAAWIAAGISFLGAFLGGHGAG